MEEKKDTKSKYIARPRPGIKRKVGRPRFVKDVVDLEGIDDIDSVRSRVDGTKRMMIEDPVLTRKIKTGGFVTYQDRIAVSEIYKSNNYNLLATAKMLGIDADTVKRYSDQVARAAVDEVRQEKIEFQLAAKKATLAAMDIKESEFIELAFDVKKQAVNIIKELLPDCNNIRDLVAVVKVMHEVGTGRKTSDEMQSELEEKPASVLMQVAIKQLNMITSDKSQDNGE